MKKNLLIGTLALVSISSGAQIVTDSLEFARSYEGSPVEMLTGQIAGVRVSSYDGSVNGALNVNIRGVNALRSDSQPLYVLDGTILSSVQGRNLNAFWQDTYSNDIYTTANNTLAYIPLYDIESIEVLKDVTATALYGSKGANGVVIIKTKQSQSEKRKVVVHSNVGFGRGISHNHHIEVGSNVKKTSYRLGASFRNISGGDPKDFNSYGSLNVGFETAANKVVWYGMNILMSVGSQSNRATTNWFGSPLPSENQAGWDKDYDDKSSDYRATSNAHMTINFTPWLSLKTVGGIDFIGNNRYFWLGNGTSLGQRYNGLASLISTMAITYNVSGELSFHRYFAQKHKLDASLGVETTGDITKFNTMNGSDFFDHSLRAKGLNIMQSKANIHNFNHNYSQFAAFAKAGYSFSNFAGVNALVRPDYSVRYRDYKPELNYSAEAWIDFKNILLRGSDVVSSLKLHGGFGVAGREIYIPYELFGTYTSGTYLAVEEGSEIYHEGLNTVRTSETNIALDFGFLKNRITGTFGFYDRVSEDVLEMYSFGRKRVIYWESKPRQLLSSISSTLANRGLEASLRGEVIRNKDTSFGLSVNGSYNVNQMLEVCDSDIWGHEVGNNLVANANAKGRQVGALVGFKTDGNGNPADQTDDGAVTLADMTILGNTIPALVGGLNADFRWKNLSVSMGLEGAAGFKVVNLSKLIETTAVRSQIYDTDAEDGDYLRLSRISAAWNFPINKVKWMDSVKVTITGANLFTLTKYSGWNPCVNSYGSMGMARGLDYGSADKNFSLYSPSIILGICLNF